MLALGLAFTGAVVWPGKAARRPRPTAPRKRRNARQRPTDGDGTGRDRSGEKRAADRSPEVDDLRNRLIQAAKREWTTTLEDFRANRAPSTGSITLPGGS